MRKIKEVLRLHFDSGWGNGRSPGVVRSARAPWKPQHVLPDFRSLQDQLQRHPHLTMQLAWEEHRQAHPEGYRYSWFCELYGRWRGKQDVVLRQEYKAGEKGFVDWAGVTALPFKCLVCLPVAWVPGPVH